MLNRILRLLFPLKCIFCGMILPVETDLGICEACGVKIEYMDEKLLEQSEQGQPPPEGNPWYDGVFCVCCYSGIVKEAIRRYKFVNRPSYYRTLAKMLSNKIKKMTETVHFDIIISVPLHPNREAERGYNQSQLLSRQVSREMGLPDCSDLLDRIRNTTNQSLLGRKERLLNIRGAFRVKSENKIKGQSVLLVDDIFTTGSTVNECSRVLKEAGAEKVFVVVLASGRKY